MARKIQDEYSVEDLPALTECIRFIDRLGEPPNESLNVARITKDLARHREAYLQTQKKKQSDHGRQIVSLFERLGAIAA